MLRLFLGDDFPAEVQRLYEAQGLSLAPLGSVCV